MEDSKERLIETVVRPLEDNAKLKSAASQFLTMLVESEPEDTEEAIRRWEEVDARKKKPFWRVLFLCLFILVSAGFWADGLHVVFNHTQFFGGTGDFFYGYPKFEEHPEFPNLSAAQRLLLFGDTSKSSDSDKMKGLWDSDPNNPAYFAAYTNAYLTDHKKLPADFLATARRIDPRNSWFTYVAAGVVAKDAVKKRGQSKAERLANKTPEWDMLDEARYHEALLLVRQARDQPEYRTYWADLLRQQVKLLPRKEPSEVAFSVGYVAGWSSGGDLGIRNLMDVMAAKAWRCGEREDRAGLNELLADAEDLLSKRTNSEVDSILSELITANAANGLVSNLSPAVNRLVIAEQSIRLKDALGEVQRKKTLMESRKSPPSVYLPYEKGGYFASNLLSPGISRRVEHPPALNEQDLEPGRLVDHEIIARHIAYFVWLGLVISLIAAWAYRFRTPPLVRRLTGRAVELLQPSDWVWMMGIGAGLPFFYVQAITRLTPLGGRELSLEYNTVAIPEVGGTPLAFLQWSGFLLLVILLSTLAIRWRLSKRATVLDFHQGRNWLLWLAILSATAFVPAVGGPVVIDSLEAGVYVAIGLFAVPMLWLLAVVCEVLFVNSPKIFQHAVVASALLPCLAAAALLAISAVPFYQIAARHWFERDELIRLDPEHPAMSKFEYECAVQMRKETRETLGYGPLEK
ncbi:MAG: hypothetical protein V4689_16035 [Verrucomicrobiota bacterium]